jgi:hypothetical protein
LRNLYKYYLLAADAAFEWHSGMRKSTLVKATKAL